MLKAWCKAAPRGGANGDSVLIEEDYLSSELSNTPDGAVKPRCGVQAPTGRVTRKTVPVVSAGAVEVRRRMVPPYLRTIPWVTQRPRPVPLGFLVEKKGSKMRALMSSGMPVPLSATVSATAYALVIREYGDPDLSAAGEGVDGVDQEVGDDLANLTRVGADEGGRLVPGEEADGFLFCQRTVQPDHFFDESGDVDLYDVGGLAIEGEGLPGDFADAG